MVREGKLKGSIYLDHRTVDGQFGIITDTYAATTRAIRRSAEPVRCWFLAHRALTPPA